MSNQIQFSELLVDTLLPTWTGVELWHATGPAGPFTLLATIPYVAHQTAYTYTDAAGLTTDWYELRRYGPGPTYGSYSAAWTVTAPVGQVTLAQIEQATAPRLGPYVTHTQSSTSHATTSLAYFDTLKSNANPGGVENLWMLRRGVLSSGALVTVATADRQRLAATYDPLAGSVAPDRLWTTPPADGEVIEFMHLDPVHELRPAVLSGLARCYFEDRVALTLPAAGAEHDLTTLAWWITRPDQVRRYQVGPLGTTLLPDDVGWTQPFEQGGHVWLAGSPDGYPSALVVTALRPVSTWVNGADSATGPTLDTDTLSVSLEYAAAAAHIEAWKLFPAKLKLAADGGFQSSQQAAASEFTRQAGVQRRRRRPGWSLGAPFSVRSVGAVR
jgi:hypothetical protein